MAIYKLEDISPAIHETAWVADNATVLGHVTLAAQASIWFGAVLRGDTEHIAVGSGSNIQDACVLHADPGQPLCIGERVTVGHQAMLHGCSVGDESLIGIGAVILNGAKIGKNCLVGARALVTENKTFADGSLILGSPARLVRQLREEEIEGLRASALRYIENAHRFRQTLTPLPPNFQ